MTKRKNHVRKLLSELNKKQDKLIVDKLTIIRCPANAEDQFKKHFVRKLRRTHPIEAVFIATVFRSFRYIFASISDEELTSQVFYKITCN